MIPVPDSLHMHFGFELNLYKAWNDFIYLNNIFQEEKGSVYSFDPDSEVEVTVNGTINDHSDRHTGWTMEMTITLKLFKGDHFSTVKAGSKWAFPTIRKKRNDAEDNRRTTSTIF